MGLASKTHRNASYTGLPPGIVDEIHDGRCDAARRREHRRQILGKSRIESDAIEQSENYFYGLMDDGVGHWWVRASR